MRSLQGRNKPDKSKNPLPVSISMYISLFCMVGELYRFFSLPRSEVHVWCGVCGICGISLQLGSLLADEGSRDRMADVFLLLFLSVS